MKKLIQGIIEFRRTMRPAYRETFARLALGQSPDTLFIACSDSRVVPNLFASTDPGDLFVVRNVGNLVPPYDNTGLAVEGASEGAALDFALSSLGVKDIVVCGHSECGAMMALLLGREGLTAPHLRQWLRHGEDALRLFREGRKTGVPLSDTNLLSQLNVLQQLEHLRSFPLVREKIQEKRLALHGWWFDIASASVLVYDPEAKHFREIREEGEAPGTPSV